MDEGDYGQDYQARLNADAIERHKRATTPNKPTTPNPLLNQGGGLECLWCEEEIPEARRLAVPGCELCMKCQDIKERFPERQG